MKKSINTTELINLLKLCPSLYSFDFDMEYEIIYATLNGQEYILPIQ